MKTQTKNTRILDEAKVKDLGGSIQTIYEKYEMLSRWMPEFTAKEFLVILAMRDDRSYKVSEISASLNFPMSTTSFLIDRLVIKKVLSRMRNRNDRRVVQVRLTELGKIALAEYDLIFERIASQMLNELNDEESHKLIKLLRKIEVRD